MTNVRRTRDSRLAGSSHLLRNGDGQAPRRSKLFDVGRIRRVGRIIDEEDDPLARELLQRCGPHRLGNDVKLLLVGGDEDGDLVPGSLVEVLIEWAARSPHVIAETVEGSLACQEIHGRGEGQGRDDEDVGDRLEDETQRLCVTLDELAHDGRDDIHEPGHDGDDDSETACDDLAQRWHRMLDRHRRGRLLRAPLSTMSRRDCHTLCTSLRVKSNRSRGGESTISPSAVGMGKPSIASVDASTLPGETAPIRVFNAYHAHRPLVRLGPVVAPIRVQ